MDAVKLFMVFFWLLLNTLPRSFLSLSERVVAAAAAATALPPRDLRHGGGGRDSHAGHPTSSSCSGTEREKQRWTSDDFYRARAKNEVRTVLELETNVISITD